MLVLLDNYSNTEGHRGVVHFGYLLPPSLGRLAVHAECIVARHVLLVKDGLVVTEEGPLDVALNIACVEDPAVGFVVSIVYQRG